MLQGGRRLRRGLGWLLVVVHVGFLPVLPLLVLVGVVDVGERRVVVLVVVFGCQVRPLLALDHVVGDVGMFMLVDLGVVAVLLRCYCGLLSAGDGLDCSAVQRVPAS
jgi:hypothetical protein